MNGQTEIRTKYHIPKIAVKQFSIKKFVLELGKGHFVEVVLPKPIQCDLIDISFSFYNHGCIELGGIFSSCVYIIDFFTVRSVFLQKSVFHLRRNPDILQGKQRLWPHCNDFKLILFIQIGTQKHEPAFHCIIEIIIKEEAKLICRKKKIARVFPGFRLPRFIHTIELFHYVFQLILPEAGHPPKSTNTVHIPYSKIDACMSMGEFAGRTPNFLNIVCQCPGRRIMINIDNVRNINAHSKGLCREHNNALSMVKIILRFLFFFMPHRSIVFYCTLCSIRILCM